MANRRIEVDIIANDKASSVFGQVGGAASSLSTKLMGALGGSANAVGNLDGMLRNYNASMWRFNNVVSGVVRTAGDSIYNFTKDAINNFSALEQQHAKTMGAMATEYGKTADAQAKFLEDSQKLKQQAITLGTVGVNGKGSLNSVTDVSYAQTALVKSGMSADDLLNSNAVSDVLRFAGGNDLNVDTATQFAVNLATVFDKPVEEWGKMLDMVTKAADISVIDVEDIMNSLTYAGGIASGLDRDIEEVLAVISVMGQAGLRGNVAGTGMQAFFTRILGAGELSDIEAGNAPTKHSANLYDQFVANAIGDNGTFKDMGTVSDLLNDTMSEMNNQEQAWFAKKLFGMYQMKAAYALSGSAEGDENLIADFMDQIANQSEGSNALKYELMQASQYGKLESLGYAWEGIKTDVGDRLSPVVSTIADELIAFLSNNGNYDINWDRLREAIDESGDLIGEQYGEQLGQIVSDFGNLGVDAGLIAGALAPGAGGILGGIAKLLQGDISGAIDEFAQGIEATNTNIDGLPEDLQGSAEAARNVMIAFTALSGVNLATNIAQIITTAMNMFIAKPISWLTGKVTSGSTSVTATTSNVTVGTAQSVNVGAVPLMNVTATVVNVYGGGGGNNPGNGPGKSPGGTPTLPSGGGFPMLPSGGGFPVLPGGSSLLPWLAAGGGAAALGGSATKLLPGLTGASDLGKIVNLYNVGGKYMTASQIAKVIASKAALGGLATLGSIGAISLFGSPGLLTSSNKRVQQGSDWIDKYVAEGNTDYSSLAGNARVNDWLRSQSGYNKTNGAAIVEAEARGRAAAREEMMSYYKTGAGATYLNELFSAQMEKSGKITENFLQSVTQWTKDGHTYSGSNNDVKEILSFMYKNFGSGYKGSSTYAGKFNDSAVTKFMNQNPTLNSFSGITDSIQSVIGASNEVVSSTGNVISAVTGAMDRIQAPNISVNVTTNVDKSGFATSNVDVSSLSRSVSQRAARHGFGYTGRAIN